MCFFVPRMHLSSIFYQQLESLDSDSTRLRAYRSPQLGRETHLWKYHFSLVVGS